MNCSVTLTYHRRDRRMLCHYCNYAERVPIACPKCDSEHIYFLGRGLGEGGRRAASRSFPRRASRGWIATRSPASATSKRSCTGFREAHYDILVGTQMIAKGHDIPNVTLVGVISADIGLGMPDFRAAERTFQLLTQVAGRAGRGHLPGQVLIQTINPDHYAIRFAATQDFAGFYCKGAAFPPCRCDIRRSPRWPMFWCAARSRRRRCA